jgi:hypothetical protein
MRVRGFYVWMHVPGSCFLASGLLLQKKAEEVAKKKKEEEAAVKKKKDEAGVAAGKARATTGAAGPTPLAPAASDVTNVECIFARVWRVCAPHMSRRPKP